MNEPATLLDSPREASRPAPAPERPNFTGQKTYSGNTLIEEGKTPALLFKSVQQELREWRAFEQKVWVILAMCGVVTILYAVSCIFLQR